MDESPNPIHDVESRSLSLFFAIFPLQCQFDVFLDRALKSSDLTRADFDALYFLRFRSSSGAVMLAELCDTLNISSGTASLRIKRLTQKGLVVRRVNPRRRNTVSVRLTSQGKTTIDSILSSLTALFEDLLAGVFKPEELECYLALTSKLAARIKKDIP